MFDPKGDRTLFEYFKALAARLMWRTFELPPDPPEDPFAGVRHPVNRTPGGRGSAIALEEPTEEVSVERVGGIRSSQT